MEKTLVTPGRLPGFGILECVGGGWGGFFTRPPIFSLQNWFGNTGKSRVSFLVIGWVVRLEEPRPAASLRKLDRRWFWALQKSALAGRGYFYFGSSEGLGCRDLDGSSRGARGPPNCHGRLPPARF